MTTELERATEALLDTTTNDVQARGHAGNVLAALGIPLDCPAGLVAKALRTAEWIADDPTSTLFDANERAWLAAYEPVSS